jgi:trehalose 6-phosphate synthase/phosphatase
MDNTEKVELKERYNNAVDKLILLDYDGTLVNYAPVPETAKLSEHIYDILIKLVGNPHTEAFIITGRGYQDIDRLLNGLPIKIIAEHGAMIKENGDWQNLIADTGIWKESIIPLLDQITLKCPDSYIEEKKFSLVWHYRNAESEIGYTNSRVLIRLLNNIIYSFKLKLLDGNKVVEVLSEETGKGKAVKKLLERKNYDFILSIGDDATDEEMFEFLFHNTNAFTVKVGTGNTYAKYKIDGIRDVVSLLKHLSG